MPNIAIRLTGKMYKHFKKTSEKYLFRSPGYYLKHLVVQSIIDEMDGFMSKDPLEDKFTDEDII